MLRQRVRRIVLGLSLGSALLGALALYVSDTAIEDAAINDLLARQMDALLEADVRPEPPEQQASALKFFRPARGSTLPAPLQDLPTGITEPVEIDGIPYCVYVRRSEAGDLAYLAYPVGFVESRERWLWASAGLAGLLLFLGTWIIADRSAGRALQPYLDLLQQVRALNPGQRFLRVAVAHEDSEVQLIVETLNRRLEEIERLLERERAFAAAASHELRGPLTVISTSAELLRDPADTTWQRPLQRLERGARDAREMLDALLALSRTRESPPLVEIRLDEWLPGTVEPHLGEGAAGRVHWQLQPQTLVAPPGAVSVVFTNLFRNALQASPQAQVQVRLEPGQVVIEDDGPGIEPEHLPQVFEPGFRGKEGGSGMGLYIARALAERYGWQIQLDNRPQGGVRAVWRFTRA